MDRHKKVSVANKAPIGPVTVKSAVYGDLPKTDDSLKYHTRLRATGAHNRSSVKDNSRRQHRPAQLRRSARPLLDKTNFYAEQGGQVGDKGIIKTATGTFEVEDTQAARRQRDPLSAKSVKGRSATARSASWKSVPTTGSTPCAITPPRTS